MIDDANRADEIIDGIRALFRGVDRRKEAIDLNEIVTDVLGALHEELHDHRVTVRAELTSRLSLVPGNRLQLREVVFNLVHNAVEAMDTVVDRDRVLWVSTEVPDRETVAVAVQDTGPGIEASEADSVFEAFFTTKEKGMGLGLAICRLIVEHHGGRLSASSNGKDGALFRFVLPVASV